MLETLPELNRQQFRRQEIPEEEEPLQGKFESIQRQEIPEEEEPVQTKRKNNTGMQDKVSYRQFVSTPSPHVVIQRAKREDLAVEQSVYFPNMTVVHGWWIKPGTKGIVRKVQEKDDIEIEIITGQFMGETVKVDPSSIEAEFKPNERKIREWGSVWEVRPGIGVEVPNGNQSYLKFIMEQLDIIGKTQVGKKMIDRFSENESFRKVQNQEGPYKGLTVIIGQPPDLKQSPGNRSNQTSRLIQTGKMGGRTVIGTKIFGDPNFMIPEIRLHNRPAESSPVDYVGAQDKGVMVTPTGIRGHPDFNKTQPYDVILYHELVHALIAQLGVASRLAEIDTQINLGYQIPPGIFKDDHVEEQLVVGIMGGLGLSFSENAYRKEKRYDQRERYKAVGIGEGLEPQGKPEASDMKKFDENTVKGEIYLALRKAGLREDQALYVVQEGKKPD